MKKPGFNKPKGLKKGKTKATVNKASLQKLANKKTNKLAKQGKLNKGDKKKKIKAKQEELNQKKQNEERIQEATVTDEVESESESDPEDIEDFEFMKNASSFATANLSIQDSNSKGKKRKRKNESEDEEEDYEKHARSFQEDKKQEDMKMMLPVINKGKVIKRMMKAEDNLPLSNGSSLDFSKDGTTGKETEEGSDNDMEDADDDDTSKLEEKEYLASMTSAQQFAYLRRKLEEKKQRIAGLSQVVLEDPQTHMKKLKELRLLLGCQDPGIALSVRKYAMVSLKEIFKDIVPGYRLRIPTEKERAQRVKKETKTLRDYEASFLLNYRLFLEFLEIMAKGKQIMDKTFLTKHGITNLKTPKPASIELGKLALKCLCEMLTNHSHFNYRDNIILSIIPFTNHLNYEYSDIACQAIKSIFKKDKAGDVTLEIVRAIGKMAKKVDFDLQPKVLETFLDLKIKEVDLSGIAAKAEKMKRNERFLKYSRRERKRMKAREHLENELLETKASADKKKKLKLHTDVIQAVFETYIRVIKLAPDSDVLPAVLEGLAKFAHLINVEYFDSLFASLNRLIESGNLTTRESLHCMQTAFTILSGQGSVLNIDPAGFYKQFYCNIVPVCAEDTLDTAAVVLQCLDVMINKRRKQVSQQRILAFIKRLTTLSLQQNPEGAVAYLAAVRQLIHSYKYSDIMFDSEVQGSGVYLPYLEDPEHCCANSTSLWELHVLSKHFDPAVRQFTQHMLNKAPLAGQHQLPHTISRKSPEELYGEFKAKDPMHGIPEKSKRKKRRSVFDSQKLFELVKSFSEEGAAVLVAEGEDVISTESAQKMETS